MKNPEQAKAFQWGLDSYYEDWDSSRVALFMWGLEKELGADVVDAFSEGRATAEEDDAL